jgi:hypothetical protein
MPAESVKLCECGCGEPAPIAQKTRVSRGHVKGQPVRFIVHHHNRKSKERYRVDPGTGCWVWLRGTDQHGYGALTMDGRRWKAYRYMYEQHVGPVPEGLQLDHICRNPPCVNPAHLRPATHAQNHQNLGAYRGKRRGASYDKRVRKWEAYGHLKGVKHHLGFYATEDEAGDVAAEWRAEHMPFSQEARAAARAPVGWVPVLSDELEEAVVQAERVLARLREAGR